MNKGFLFANSSWKIKSHVVESKAALLVWPCLSHLEKNITQLITSFLMIQSASFTSAAFEAFVEAYLFLSICLGNKNAEVIKFLEIVKNYVSENKIYFCSRKKRDVSLNKKVVFVFHKIFKLDFITQIIYCIIHRYLCSHFVLFCSLISVPKKWNTGKMLTCPCSYNWQKFNNKMNEKRSQDYQSMGPEYVTRQINSRILELLLRRFYCLIFAYRLKNLNKL